MQSFYPQTYWLLIILVKRKNFHAIRCSTNILLKLMYDIPLIGDAIYLVSSQCQTFRIFPIF